MAKYKAEMGSGVVNTRIVDREDDVRLCTYCKGTDIARNGMCSMSTIVFDNNNFPFWAPQYKRRRFMREESTDHEEGGYQAAMQAQLIEREKKKLESQIQAK